MLEGSEQRLSGSADPTGRCIVLPQGIPSDGRHGQEME